MNLTELYSNGAPLCLFLDTEFTQFEDSNLISIGIVAEDGREFYAELSDNYTEADCSEFVLDTVLPLLQGGDARMTKAECAAKLKAWVETFRRPAVFVSDAPTYDSPLVHDILNLGAEWPINLADNCIIWFDVDSYDINLAMEAYFDDTSGAERHHALHDAHALRCGYMATDSSEVKRRCNQY